MIENEEPDEPIVIEHPPQRTSIESRLSDKDKLALAKLRERLPEQK